MVTTITVTGPMKVNGKAVRDILGVSELVDRENIDWQKTKTVHFILEGNRIGQLFIPRLTIVKEPF